MIEEMELTSLGWLGITLLGYLLASMLYRKTGALAIFHPLIFTSLIVGACLWFFSVSVDEYQQYAAVLHWMLGPATLALAVPLYRQFGLLKRLGSKVLIPVMAGGVCAMGLMTGVLYFIGMPEEWVMSSLTRSITTPLALETTALIGGIPALAAVLVIFTGIIGSMLGPWVFRWCRIKGQVAKGLALGTCAHAIGTARALQIGDKAGAFSTLALCINGLVTAILLPLALYFVG